MSAEDRSPAVAARPRRRPRRWAFALLGVVVTAYLAGQVLPRPTAGPARGAADERLIAEVRRWGGQVLEVGATTGFFGFGARPLYTVSLSFTPVDDAALARLGPLLGDRVTSLSLLNTRVTDAGLAGLAGLSRLVVLELGNSGRALRPGAPPERWSRTLIRGPGLEHLAALGSLRTLHLPHTDIDDAGLAHVKRLTRLQNLSLAGTPIRGPGLEHLKGMPLTSLTLDGTAQDDPDLLNLDGLDRLMYLSRGGVAVEPEALAGLKRFPRLGQVRLAGSGLLPEDLTAVRKALPGVRFELH
jgi:hypothetical protein